LSGDDKETTMHRRSFSTTLTATAALAMTLSLISTGQGAAQGSIEGEKIGHWKPWVLSSATGIPVPPPPAENSDQTKKELEELRRLQSERSSITNTAIQYYNAVPATQRWHDELVAQGVVAKLSPNRFVRLFGILHTALHDAVIAAYAAKYQYNRKPPTLLAPDLTAVATVNGAVYPLEPTYPSEHAAIAGAAVALLSAWFPADEASLKAMADELGQTRLAMGANYRSDVDAGMLLGQKVAEQALARAAHDNSDGVWTGTAPTGPGVWAPAPGTAPLEPLQGQWKPWLMARGDQFRPGPPPAFDSAETKAELALIKRISSNPTPSQRAIALLVPAKPGLGYFFDPIFAVLQRERVSAARETRVLGLVAAALVDAGIASHDTKFFYWRARPNMLDPTIVPLIGQPNHPAYVSNAAIIGSVITEVMGTFFPQELTAFRYRAEESGLSRIYAGIHFPSDERVGQEMGKQIAALALARDQQNGN
jgi:membrane-associated phospholipid phosphatase